VSKFLKPISVILLCCLVWGLACKEATPKSSSVSLTDDLGRTVTVKGVPKRIVSLAPSITEILFALDLGDKVVGVTSACDYPEEAKAKPKVGDYFMSSLEVIVAQDPDIVFADGHDPVCEDLDSKGISMVVLQPRDIDGISRDIELVGRITGKEREANVLVAERERRIKAVADKIATVKRPTVFYVIDASDPSKPWTAGSGSFIDALITLAGGENIVKVPELYFQINLEEVVARDPGIIIGPAKHGTAFIPDLKGLAVWKEMSAVKAGKVYLIEDDLVSRPGPRVVDGLEEMAKAIHPELFP
jgi:iron complex transport system substrate-binding protein